MKHEVVFRLEEHLEEVTDQLKDGDFLRVRQIEVMNRNATWENALELVTCPMMVNAIDLALKYQYDWKRCKGCHVQVIFSPLLGRRLTFGDTCKPPSVKNL